MSIETREWQRKRDKRTYLRMLEGTDGGERDPKDAYYDPKQFRGSKSASGSERSISTIAVASLVVGGLLLIGVADYAANGQTYAWVHSKTTNKALVADELKKQESAPAKTETASSKDLMTACARRDYASAQDIQVFRDYADDFVKKADEVRQIITRPTLSKNEKIAQYNKLVLQAKGAIAFYNERLVKCYRSPSISNDVQARAKSINQSLDEMRALVQ